MKIVLSFFLIFLLISCSTAPKKRPQLQAPADAKKELSQAQVEIAAGDDRRAVARLKNLMVKHPESDVADDAGIALGKIQFKNQQYQNAYNTFMALVNSDVFSPNEGEALLGASRSLYKLGRLDESSALAARGIKIPGLSPSVKLDLQKHRFSVLNSLGDRVESLSALAYVFASDPKPEIRSGARVRALEIVNHSLNESDLEKVSSSSELNFIRAEAAYQLAHIKLKNKNYDSARTHFSHSASWANGTPLGAQAQSYLDQIDSRRSVDSSVIGAVLPLSGKYASIAQKTLHGLQMGLGIYGNDKSSLKLAVVDSEEGSDGARRAVERLVTEDHALAIVGSLLSRDALTVASKAEELGIPSIALSQKANLTEVGPYTFRNAITSTMQVRELVKVAMEQLGLRRFAILFPNDTYGTEYANLFWDEVLSRGGQITGAQPYSPSETDFRGPIKRLVGTYYVESRKAEYSSRLRDWFKKQKRLSGRQAPPDDLLPPIVDFEALFVPDTPKAIGQIAPMLAYQGISNVRLLGTNVWNSPELPRRGQQGVEKALFVDSNLLNESAFKNSKFYREFEQTFSEVPGMFEVQGYETGLLLRKLIESGERSRPNLAKALSSIVQSPAVVGSLEMTKDRELVRPLTSFTVKNSEILAWTQALENPESDSNSVKKRTSK